MSHQHIINLILPYFSATVDLKLLINYLTNSQVLDILSLSAQAGKHECLSHVTSTLLSSCRSLDLACTFSVDRNKLEVQSDFDTDTVILIM